MLLESDDGGRLLYSNGDRTAGAGDGAGRELRFVRRSGAASPRDQIVAPRQWRALVKRTEGTEVTSHSIGVKISTAHLPVELVVGRGYVRPATLALVEVAAQA